jgi:hypothetical protein
MKYNEFEVLQFDDSNSVSALVVLGLVYSQVCLSGMLKQGILKGKNRCTIDLLWPVL